MTNLTGKQKRFLRSRGQTMRDSATIGHNGLTDATRAHIQSLLAQHELIKIRLGEEVGSDRKDAAADLADATSATVAGVVGRTVLLYRANPDLPDDKRLQLPAD